MASTISDIKLIGQLTYALAETNQGVPLTAGGGLTHKLELTSGTTVGTANRSNQNIDRTLSSGAAEDLDMYDLAGFASATDLLRNAVTYAEIVGLLIVNSSASVGTLLVGGKGTTAAWNSLFNANDDAELTLPPNSFVMLGCSNDPGWAVADTSNHLLTMTASGGAVTYSIYVIGRSA